MSDYQRHSDCEYGYDTVSSASQIQDFNAYALPPYAAQFSNLPLQVSQPPIINPPRPFIADSESTEHDRERSAVQTLSNTDSSSRQLPEIIFYSPSEGVYGSKVFIYIRSQCDLLSPQQYHYTVMFGIKRCEGKLTKFDQRDNDFQYAVAADIPAFDTTDWLENRVPLCLSMQDGMGQPMGMVEVGDFTYLEVPTYLVHGNSGEHMSRKRKLSEVPHEPQETQPKRIASQPLREQMREDPGLRAHSSGPALSPYVPPNIPAGIQGAGYRGPADRSQLRYDHLNYASRQPSSGSSYTREQSSLTSGYNLYASGIAEAGQNALTGAGAGRSKQDVFSSSASASNPPLIRTSALGDTGNSVQTFNPYAMFPNAKAQLKLDGDLDKMTEEWTPEEWETRRRLVQFRRSQSGSIITTTFQPVWAAERAPNSICVSCIWWEEKQECYATSVDTIHLLEALVAVRFTVEEKNRIRRNLEGFRPLTVSKGKADSESFFKLIMGFPNPKPRNIEKDVKVFPWKILTHALKKIISKYSASYSSTAGALPAAMTGPSTLESGYEQQTHSPRSTVSTVTTNAFPTNLTSSTLPPNLKKISSQREVSSSIPDRQMAASDFGTVYWQTQLQSNAQMQQQHQYHHNHNEQQQQRWQQLHEDGSLRHQTKMSTLGPPPSGDGRVWGLPAYAATSPMGSTGTGGAVLATTTVGDDAILSYEYQQHAA